MNHALSIHLFLSIFMKAEIIVQENCNVLKLTLLVGGWAGIWIQVSLSLKSTWRHIGDPMPLQSSLANVPQRTCHHFESKNPNECPTPMCNPGLPSADGPREEPLGVPVDHERALGRLLLPRPPQGRRTCVFETSRRLRQKEEPFPRNQPSSPRLASPLLVNSGEAPRDFAVSKAVICPFAHYYILEKILLTGCHQVFFLLHLLSSKFNICFHYSIKGIDRNSIQNIRAFTWIILWLWSLHSKCLYIKSLKNANNRSFL